MLGLTLKLSFYVAFSVFALNVSLTPFPQITIPANSRIIVYS